MMCMKWGVIYVIDELYTCDIVTLYVLMNGVKVELLFCLNHLKV